jgi:hypothetical protein
MRKYLVPVVLLIAAGCGGNDTEKTEKKTKKVNLPVVESTAYKFTFDPGTLPKGYELDSLMFTDTVKKVNICFQYIENNTEAGAAYTEAIIGAIFAVGNKELSYYEPKPVNSTETSDVKYGVVDFSVGKNFISIRLVKDSYTEGAAHHNYSWFSFNYNVGEGKMWWNKELFTFKTQKDSLDFIGMIGRNLDDHAVEMSVPFDSVDVFIRNDKEFLFGPSLSWADGMRTAILPLDSVWKFSFQRLN